MNSTIDPNDEWREFFEKVHLLARRAQHLWARETSYSQFESLAALGRPITREDVQAVAVTAVAARFKGAVPDGPLGPDEFYYPLPEPDEAKAVIRLSPEVHVEFTWYYTAAFYTPVGAGGDKGLVVPELPPGTHPAVAALMLWAEAAALGYEPESHKIDATADRIGAPPGELYRWIYLLTEGRTPEEVLTRAGYAPAA